jgi:hypothetical protein
VALLLCLATAVAYAELSKLYPGARQLVFFLRSSRSWIMKRPGSTPGSRSSSSAGARIFIALLDLVGVTGIFVGYVVGTLWPNSMSASNPGLLAIGIAAVWAIYGGI